jgi:hypothetical protein
MMTISLMDDDGWGESVEGFCWSDTGNELLVQLTESLRVYHVKESVEEVALRRVELDEILGIGWAAGDWWTVARHEAGIAFRRGLEGRDTLLELAPDGLPSAVTVSPDGRTLAGAVNGSKLVFWSTGEGKRLFSLRLEAEELHPLGGSLSLESMRWSPDARYLGVHPGLPLGELLVIDVDARRVIE